MRTSWGYILAELGDAPLREIEAHDRQCRRMKRLYHHPKAGHEARRRIRKTNKVDMLLRQLLED